MRAIPKVDANGLYIEDVIQDDTFSGIVPFYTDPTDTESPIVSYLIGTAVPSGLYQPKWDLKNDQWVEGLTQAEIDALKELSNSQPATNLTQMQQELTNTQLALSDTFEQLATSQQETTNLQLAVADLYEQLTSVTSAQGGGK